MTDAEDPVDRARTTRPRAGMVWQDRRELPGLALVVVSVLILVASLTTAALLDAGWAIGLGVVALATGVGGVSWMLLGRRRAARR